MGHPVFISYARKASREQAVALHEVLGGAEGLAFLDTEGIEPGEHFPRHLADALLASRVVVVFATKEYFRRWYCLWELETVLGPFLALGDRATEEEKERALVPIIVALPVQEGTRPDLLPLPPGLQARSWPSGEDLGTLEQLIRARLEDAQATLGERLKLSGGPGEGLRRRLLEESALPEPKNLAQVEKRYPRALPPSLGRSFVGRADELWRIHYTLSVLRDRRGEGAAGAALTGALHGAGGFGKTRLALEYLHRLGPNHYPGGLFWVNADVGPDGLEEQFHGILRTLEPGVPDLVTFRESKRDAAQEMAKALDTLAARERVLYVVDNVPEPGPQESPRPLETWCPVVGRASLLATSRARLDLGSRGVHPIPIFALAPEASVALLTDGVGRGRLAESDWLQIVAWVEFLPLALELLNRAMKAGGVEPVELLARARKAAPIQELDRQASMLRRHVPSKELRGVTEAFSLSYERLSTSEQRAARLIAHLAPSPIPLGLLEALGAEVAADEVRGTLRGRHFVTPSEGGEVAMFGIMHRVLADYLRRQASEPLSELGRLSTGLLSVMKSDACEDPKSWPLLSACLPHAEEVFVRLLKSGAHAEREVMLGLAMSTFLRAKGLSERSRGFEEETVSLSTVALGPEHPHTLLAMSNLARTLYVQGDLAGARALQERVLEARLRLIGETHQDTFAAMGNLATTLHAQGDLAGARVLQERVLEASQRVLGESHFVTFTVMSNLALTLKAQGDLPGARVLQERALEASQRELGAEHPDSLKAMGNLAVTLNAQGDLSRARVLEERVLEGSQRVLGEEHPDVLKAMSNLATTLYAQKDLAGARVLQERALEGSRRVLGEAHPDTITVTGNLAAVLSEQGEMEGARALQERVLEARRRVLGEQHPDTLMAMSNLATSLYAQKDMAGARALQQSALEMRRRVLGEEHPDTLTAMGNLAAMLFAQGDMAEAYTLEMRVLETRRRVLGEEHPDTLTAMGNLAMTLYAKGDMAGMRTLAERLLEARRRASGEEHPSTLTAMNMLAMAMFRQGEVTTARAIQERVLETRRRVLGEKHPDTLSAQHNLAEMCKVAGISKPSSPKSWLKRLLGWLK
jgi:hypothetical protein